MESRDPQKQLWSCHVNLDKRVRSDHPLRKLNEVLKLDFVREEVTKVLRNERQRFGRPSRYHKNDAALVPG